MAAEKTALDFIKAGDLNALLSVCSAEDLDPLVQVLLSKLSNGIDINEDYKRYAPDHTKYYELIGKDLRLFGGNSLRNLFRGEGPSYDEIVLDVCKKLDVPCETGKTVQNEENLLTIYLDRQWKALSPEQQEEFLAQARTTAAGDLSSAAMLMKEGAKFLLLRSIAGPLGWGGLIISAADPSFKVTVPCVLHIAYLRKKHIERLTQPQPAQLPLNSPQLPASIKADLPVEPVDRGQSLIVGGSHEASMLVLTEVAGVGDREWIAVGRGDKAISRLNPLLQAVPGIAVAQDVATSRYMEVVINGPLLQASDGDGFRAMAKAAQGVEHGRLYEATALSNLVNAAAVWQIASVVVAQKHLADINAKLSELKSGISKIIDFQRNERKSLLTGAIRYFEQVAPSVLVGETSEGIRHQIERHEADLLRVQDHLLDDIQHESAALLDVKAKPETIEAHQKVLESLYRQLLLCIRARACGWQLLLVFPGEELLKEGRKKSILETLEILAQSGEMLNRTDAAVRAKVQTMSSSWGMTANKEKLLLLGWIQALEDEVARCTTLIESDIRVADLMVTQQGEPIRLLAKVEGERIVAFSPT